MNKINDSVNQTSSAHTCTIWGTTKSIIRHIQRQQNRAARIVYNLNIINVKSIYLVNDLEWLTVSQRK